MENLWFNLSENREKEYQWTETEYILLQTQLWQIWNMITCNLIVWSVKRKLSWLRGLDENLYESTSKKETQEVRG